MLALAGCSTGPPRMCGGVGASRSVSLTVKPPLGEKVSKATVKVCWDDTCRTPRMELAPETESQPIDCTPGSKDRVCGASAVPTGGKYGRTQVRDLPNDRRVTVTVTLFDASGRRVLHDSVSGRPTLVHPNGKQCDPEGTPQLHLTIAHGELRLR